MSKSLTYKEAGVDIRSGERFAEAVGRLASLTHQPGLIRGVGSFGGLITLPGKAKDAVLVASADGVGTKLKIAQRVGRFTALGVDLVAMNVNDLVCTGARPLFFLDYIAAGKLQKKVLLEIVRGIVRGCVESGCILLGGETAEMPLCYRSGEFDLAGFSVGMVSRRKLVTGAQIRAGDCVLGLPSNGLHANGFTLVQKALSPVKLKRFSPQLLAPTRIYVQPVLKLIEAGLPIRGIAHVTGGSFVGKIPRVLPKGLSIVLRKGSWKIPAIFSRIQAEGVSEAEMYRTFNMGIGMVLVLPSRALARTQGKLKRFGLTGQCIGEVTKGQGEVVFV